MYIKRNLTKTLKNYASKFRIVAIIGPRQVGKTTLAKKAFPDHKYFSLEDPDTLEMLQADPRDFLESDYQSKGIILDEFQNHPQLLSYLQGIVDKNPRPGYFVLTTSHNFLMNQAISQSLAGRVAILSLLPLSLNELNQQTVLSNDIDTAVFSGGYPDIHSTAITPTEFYPQYTKTYVERDVRQLSNVINLTDFQRFMRLCAGRIGQLLNVSSLSDDCNVSVPTINAWLSILEASFVVFRLQPHFKNISKRLIKSPKIYFYDTGLACWLLKISSPEQLKAHYLRGGLVESMIISELYKSYYHSGQEPSMYFWRDSHGHEIDCILDYGTTLIPIEIKSGKTINQRFFEGLGYWCKLSGMEQKDSYVVYAGNEEFSRAAGHVVSWKKAGGIVK